MGMFITLEGPDGAGKSTQAALLVAALEHAGWSVRALREPGASALGDRLRSLLLAADACGISARAEALLYTAARAQLVVEAIEPALGGGAVVVSDRYADSTLAYQGYGRGVPVSELRAVVRFAVGEYWPDLTFLIDVPVDIGLQRKAAAPGARDDSWTRFEAETLAFHERVRAGYLDLAAGEPSRWIVLDGLAEARDVHAHIWREVQRRLPSAPPRRLLVERPN